MTRINTNVSSLIAQSNLARTNNQLQTALTRLSTGLRINSGKDDPAGLIASEALRSDIASIQKAISNSQRANQIIATADSALGQVSSLLTDIRSLVTEAANKGALSDEEIAANQLQIDASLDAINRISQTTTFQGRRLLDGSLDFLTTLQSVSSVVDGAIHQANLGSTGELTVDVDINSAATRAEITTASGAFSPNTQATATLKFRPELRFAAGTFADTNTDITIIANEPGEKFEGVTVQFQADTTPVGQEFAEYDEESKTLTIHINNSTATTAANVVAAVNALTQFEAVVNAAGAIDGSGADASVTGTTDADEVVITAVTAGPDFNNLAISVVADSSVPAGSPTAVYDETANTLKIFINDTNNTALTAIATAINNLAEFTATANANGDGNVNGGTADADATANTNNTGGGTLLADLVVQIAGKNGAQVFTFQEGASINDMVAAIKLVADATGVTASQSGGILTLRSTDYGSKAFVQADVISEGSGGQFKKKLSANRATGTDIDARINGVQATADGNTFSINTASLQMTLTVKAGTSDGFTFEITGGGALFQLGPDVVSTQQVRLGITSVSTASLGGINGRLYELATGGSKSLVNDPTGAAAVIDEVINKVASLRGRLGAFQRAMLDTNIASLNDTLTNLTEAESTIRDADFAKETAALTRAQILVQAGTSVLAIANQNPQNVLALLR